MTGMDEGTFGDAWFDPAVLSEDQLRERREAPPFTSTYASLTLEETLEKLGEDPSATLADVTERARLLGWTSHYSYRWEDKFVDEFIDACTRNGLIDKESIDAVYTAIEYGLQRSKGDKLPAAEVSAWMEDLDSRYPDQGVDDPNGPFGNAAGDGPPPGSNGDGRNEHAHPDDEPNEPDGPDKPAKAGEEAPAPLPLVTITAATLFAKAGFLPTT